jgi:hypothetical protein
VKSNSFKEVPGFVNINPDQDYQFDDNDLPFAVIKVRTENITDKQRRELRFEGNGGTFIVLEYKTGEVWVYLTAKYADYLKISVRLEGYEPAAQRLEIKKGEEIALEFALVSEIITEENNEVINQISEPMAVEKKEGIFSISPRNEVVFSKGNVRLKSSDKRKFTDNQWDKGDLIAFDEIQSVVDSVWFVLSSDEWKYLLTKRRTDSGIRYAKATVNGVFGLVLLPDDWKTTIYGIKDGTDGYYWSSDPEDTPYLRFNNAMLSTSTNVFDQKYGLSVRLVKENL